MKKIFILMVLLPLFVLQASAVDFTAPEVPESGRDLMPYETESFAEGAWSIIQEALSDLQPQIRTAAASACSIIGLSLLLSSVKLIPGSRENVTEMIGVVSVTLLLMGTSNSMVRLASQTVTELSEYGKLLFPVLTAALAAQGGSATSAALYAGTLAFDAFLSALVSTLLVPMMYVYLCMSIISAATGQEFIGKLKDFSKWLMTWSMKILLYIFTGYMGITGVVSGHTDAAALKATKLAISGMVPVVGGILSDTSEAILVGTGVMKSAVGIYGLLSILAVWINPFLKIGLQYLTLKASYGLCGIFPTKQTGGLIKDFSGAMGFLLAMTGSVCLFLLISVVCFMKGVG